MKCYTFMVFVLLLLICAPSAMASCNEIISNTEKQINYYANSFSSKCIKLTGLDLGKTVIIAETAVIAASDNQYGDQKTYLYEITNNSGTKIHTQIVDSEIDVYKFSGNSQVTLTLNAMEGASDHDYTFNVINKSTGQGFSIIYIYVQVKKLD